MYKTVIFSVVLYGYETWSLTLRDVHQNEGFLEQGFEDDIWTLKKGRHRGENCIMMNFTACILHRTFLG